MFLIGIFAPPFLLVKMLTKMHTMKGHLLQVFLLQDKGMVTF